VSLETYFVANTTRKYAKNVFFLFQQVIGGRGELYWQRLLVTICS